MSTNGYIWASTYPNDGVLTYKVTVNDVPIAKCKTAILYLNEFGVATIHKEDINDNSYDPDGTISKYEVSPFNVNCANIGENNVTLTVTDNEGTTATCTAKVTVVDNRPPGVICQPKTIYLNENGVANIQTSDLILFQQDNCGVKSSTSKTNFTCEDLGINSVEVTVKDNEGNSSSCFSSVTVKDDIDPVAICKTNNVIAQLDENGEVSITPDQLDNGSSDTCGLDPDEPFQATQTEFDCNDLGQNTIVLTVKDLNGNTSTCNATVTVEDNIRPLVHTRNVDLFLDKNGRASVDVGSINNGSTDNCTISRLWLEGQTEYNCGSTGVHQVVLKVEDQSGNIGQSNANVTIRFYKPDFESMLGIKDGDTLHQVNCQVPRDIALSIQDHAIIKKYGILKTSVNKVKTPENTPWSQYSVWQHELVMEDACAHNYRFTFYQALYDLTPPVFQHFPADTTIATPSDLPDVDDRVKILDVCQYVAWDTVTTTPMINPESGDTVAYTRRWMARDPSGHQGFRDRDQMIWIGTGDRDQYGTIHGRIADENQIQTTLWEGEAGTNGIPVSLYRLDTVAGSTTWVESWTTGDRMGAQGRYYFTSVLPGTYQVRIDSALCLDDTLKFDKDLWSDTLLLSAGETLDHGWIITQPCVDTVDVVVSENIGEDVAAAGVEENTTRSSVNDKSGKSGLVEWNLYPNPSQGYLQIDIHSNKMHHYQMYDALGRSVKYGEYHKGQSIDVSDLHGGLYYLQLRDQNKFLGMKKVLLISGK